MYHLYTHRFYTNDGRLIYVPSDEGRKIGRKLSRKVRAKWSVPHYFFHLKNGGHIAAVKCHIENPYMLKFDLKSFFWSCTRSKLYRSLKMLGFTNDDAFAIASCCTVNMGKPYGHAIPFGFVRSPIMASIVLDRCALGVALKEISSMGVMISVYVDDIVVSSNCKKKLDIVRTKILKSCEQSRFEISEMSDSYIDNAIEVFNIIISCGIMRLSDERLRKFEDLEKTTDQRKENAIISYVRSINEKQAIYLSGVYEIS